MYAKVPVVYIIASQRNGTLYVGVTSNLIKCASEHRTDAVFGFAERYGAEVLVYFEIHASMADAILREKQLKKWNRAWKLRLIEAHNPSWRDLWVDLIAAG